MGFFDEVFGSTESYANPQRRIGEQMPGAMNEYFRNIQAQIQSAMAQREATKQRQFDLFEQMFGAQAKGLEETRKMIEDRPSFVDQFDFVGDVERVGRQRLGQEMSNIQKRSDAAAISRGLGMSTVPLARTAAGQAAMTANFEGVMAQMRGDVGRMKVQEEAQRRGDLENIMRMQSSLEADRLGKRARLEQQYAPYVFDPTAFMKFETQRAGMQPWGMMRRPVEYRDPGFLGGQVGNMLGAAGGAAIAGLI